MRVAALCFVLLCLFASGCRRADVHLGVFHDRKECLDHVGGDEGKVVELKSDGETAYMAKEDFDRLKDADGIHDRHDDGEERKKVSAANNDLLVNMMIWHMVFGGNRTETHYVTFTAPSSGGRIQPVSRASGPPPRTSSTPSFKGGGGAGTSGGFKASSPSFRPSSPSVGRGR